MKILNLVEGHQRKTASEALYYCLRALKQAGLPNNSKKDYFFDSPTSTPSDEGVKLAKHILAEIISAEGAELDLISELRIYALIQEVAEASDTVASRVDGFNILHGAELLNKLRQST
jgi:hypothetical protein